ncbi:MAG TPA: VWA domain-containing protein [Acidobacteriaceae bacterium]|nr:VWA domain-containing protein [Acidobacteriaceae bacterium]
MRRVIAAVLAAGMVFSPAGVPLTAGAQASNAKTTTLHANVDRVLTNVVVRDKKTGELIKGLKKEDFTIVEDKKPQQIRTFDYQNVDEAVTLAEATTVSGSTTTLITAPEKKTVADLVNNNFAAKPDELKDRRLIVMFFDLSSMQPEDVTRAVDAAKDYINTKMAPADLAASVSLVSSLSMDQDFTNDKGALLAAVSKYDGSEGSGFDLGSEGGGTDSTSDDSSSFVADDSEFNSLNTDRQLLAIRTICKSIEKVEQKKSMLYFSGGLSRQGIENQASIRAATNECVKADTAMYAVDTRGLQALNPVGDASQGSKRGTSAYSGASMQGQLNSNFSSQETLGTLASDTGGKLFVDDNDFAPAFQAVQHDTEAYYIIGYSSTNAARDGSYRHLTITLAGHPEAKLEYRPGYYAPADFQHAKTEDRELALTEQMRSETPATDVSLYMQALYFRLEDGKFYIPVSLVIPGSQINAVTVKDKDKATIDILGQVKDAQNLLVGQVRQSVPIAVDANMQLQKKNVQYSTGWTLAPGKYHIKFVVRENQSGNMGSFETDIQVPDMKKTPLKLSSVVMSSQRTPNTVKKTIDPLVRDGQEWVPNVSHVFRQDQHLFFLYEVYSPAKEKDATQTAAATQAQVPGLTKKEEAPVHVLTSIEFLLGGVKVFETPMVEATSINIPERDAVAFQFDIPLNSLKPGTYVCQVNVIDDAGGNFSFPRMALRVTPAAAPATPAATPVAALPAAPASTAAAPAL